MTLKEQILKRAQVDFEVITLEHKGLDCDYYAFFNGAACENARLRPLIEALAECVEALEAIAYPMGKENPRAGGSDADIAIGTLFELKQKLGEL